MGLFSFDTLRGFLESTNILQRMNKIGELLEKEQADVILLQEVHTYLVLNLLKTKLTSYPYISYKRYLYGPRGGLVTFSKHPLENNDYINYQTRGSMLNKSIVAHVIQNGILVCKIKNTSTKIINTYITPNMDYDFSKNNRYSRYIEAQLRQLAQVIKHDAAKETILIGGDFNTDKRSYLYTMFLKLSQATDLFTKDDVPTKHQAYYPSHQLVERLDYIFYSGKKTPTILSTKHLFTKKIQLHNKKFSYLSDHIALKATIKW